MLSLRSKFVWNASSLSSLWAQHPHLCTLCMNHSQQLRFLRSATLLPLCRQSPLPETPSPALTSWQMPTPPLRPNPSVSSFVLKFLIFLDRNDHSLIGSICLWWCILFISLSSPLDCEHPESWAWACITSVSPVSGTTKVHRLCIELVKKWVEEWVKEWKTGWINEVMCLYFPSHIQSIRKFVGSTFKIFPEPDYFSLLSLLPIWSKLSWPQAKFSLLAS